MTHLQELIDNAEVQSAQFRQLWALFSQIRSNLEQNRPHPATMQLLDIGNYLADTWATDCEMLKDQLESNHDGRQKEEIRS